MKSLINLKIYLIFFILLFIFMPTKIKGQDLSILTLDNNTSVILPHFDTSSIVNSNINSIILSLYVLDKFPNSSTKINITINPVDLNTNIVENGLSAFIDVKKDNYIDFILPKELFEKTIRTQKRFLVRLVDTEAKLLLKGPDSVGTTIDPKLVIQHEETNDNEALDQPRIITNNYYNIQNSQFHFGQGDNIRRDKIELENFIKKWYEKPLGIIVITVIGSLLAAFFVYKFGWNR